MSNAWAYLDLLLFGVLPYIALATFFLGTIQRYRTRTYSYSSLSSQFLENRQHFWGLVPFHYGLLVVLGGHVLGFLIPRHILLWNSVPLRLWFLEITGLAFAFLALVGLGAAMVRRASVPKVLRVTTGRDWVLLGMLLVQIGSGIGVALFHPWGSSWFATSASPYLWSIATLNPQTAWMAPMPWMVKLHIVNAWLLIGFFPFTRLVHVLVVPNPYLWRKPQVVRWYGRPGERYERAK
jgi:nitrate reductase gamma subunit